MNLWFEGFQLALSGANLLFLLLGTCIGLIVGVIPVVGPSFGVTLALPFTSGMDPATAVILLAAIQSSAAYGDSIASILINVPGGPGTVASMWEGYPMTRKGKAGTALGIATGASFVGGLLGWLSFVLLAAPMTAFALMIGAPEYFVLGVAALALISIASKGETVRGLIMGCMGLLLGMMGPDPVSGITYRFSFGIAALEPGIDIALGALAIFALPQLVTLLEEGGTIARVAEVKDSVLGGVIEAFRRPRSLIRGGIIGWLIGVLPALGTSAAGISSYLIEKKFSKERDQFGQGSIDGLTAAEVGKGACVLGDGITSLLLGVPGSVTWAILMAALIVHGIQPGPRFMTAGVLPYTVFRGSVAQPTDVLRDWDSACEATRAHCSCPNRDPRADGSHSLFSGRLCDKELCFRHLDHGGARSFCPWRRAPRLSDRPDDLRLHTGGPDRSEFPSRAGHRLRFVCGFLRPADQSCDDRARLSFWRPVLGDGSLPPAAAGLEKNNGTAQRQIGRVLLRWCRHTDLADLFVILLSLFVRSASLSCNCFFSRPGSYGVLAIDDSERQENRAANFGRYSLRQRCPCDLRGPFGGSVRAARSCRGFYHCEHEFLCFGDVSFTLAP